MFSTDSQVKLNVKSVFENHQSEQYPKITIFEYFGFKTANSLLNMPVLNKYSISACLFLYRYL